MLFCLLLYLGWLYAALDPLIVITACWWLFWVFFCMVLCLCLFGGWVVLGLGFWVGLWFAGFCFMLFRYFVVDGFGGLL